MNRGNVASVIHHQFTSSRCSEVKQPSFGLVSDRPRVSQLADPGVPVAVHLVAEVGDSNPMCQVGEPEFLPHGK